MHVYMRIEGSGDQTMCSPVVATRMVDVMEDSSVTETAEDSDTTRSASESSSVSLMDKLKAPIPMQSPDEKAQGAYKSSSHRQAT